MLICDFNVYLHVVLLVSFVMLMSVDFAFICDLMQEEQLENMFFLIYDYNVKT